MDTTPKGRKRTTQALASALLLSMLLSVNAHAQDHRTASATLHVQVFVMPTVVAPSQPANSPKAQPAFSPIIYSLQPQSGKRKYSIEESTVTGEPDQPQHAVLRTATIVVN
jgi:hypothetical protein